MDETHTQPTECEICGETLKTDRHGMYLEEVGEFWDEEKQTGIVAHGQCGLDAELQLA